MKILLTGGSGFFGRNIFEQLKHKYDILNPSSTELNLMDKAAVDKYISSNAFDIVIHSAWWNSTRNSNKDLTKCYENNLGMFTNVTENSSSFGKILYFGTGAEYGSREHYLPKMTEDYYGKYGPGEESVRAKHDMMKIASQKPNIINLRAFAVFGKYEDWEIRYISNAICKTIFDLPITIKRNVFFDYMYIDDLVKITDWFINSETHYNVYNVCTGKTIDLLSLANIVLKIAHKKLPVVVNAPGLNPEYSGDNSRLMKEIGNFVFSDLESDIAKLYAWYLANKNLIDRNKLLFDK